jgi:polysaccharide pyruvyl transferase WcaK-like protein
MRTIAAVGAYGYRNFGDDALMRAVAEVTKTAAPFDCLVFRCAEEAYVGTVIPGARIVPPDNPDTHDIVVYGGGTQFFSFPCTSPSIFHRVARNCRHPIRMTHNVLRAATAPTWPSPRARMAAIGIGVGPFVRHSPEIRRTKLLLRQMEYIAVRDVSSFEMCRQWGISHAVLRADLCYLPGLWKPFVCTAQPSAARTMGRRVGVIVRDWPHTLEGDSYARPLVAVVDQLRSAGRQVEFISFAESYDRGWLTSLRARGERPRTWSPGTDDISSFLRLLSGYDVFLTARYHGAVFASMLGKPMVCIEVEPKLRLVSELLGNGARLWRYPFDVEQCLQYLAEIDGDYSRSAQHLCRVVQEQGVLADTMAAEYRQMLSI